MTKDVLVTVKGLQSMEDGSPPEEVEMVAKGEYYYKNGHHYIFYNETIEGFTEQNRNSIKISENSVEVKKKGLTNMQMIFEEQKKNISYYAILQYCVYSMSNNPCYLSRRNFSFMHLNQPFLGGVRNHEVSCSYSKPLDVRL